jgi:hypothetical protein
MLSSSHIRQPATKASQRRPNKRGESIGAAASITEAVLSFGSHAHSVTREDRRRTWELQSYGSEKQSLFYFNGWRTGDP